MKAALRMAVAFGLGCASIWLLYTVLYHVNPFEVVATGSRLAFESTTGNRSYALWLVWNLIDFATFLSLPIVLLLIINLVRSRSVGLPRSIWPLTVASFTTLILLDLSGSVRGEVGRLWIYFGPLFVLIALAGNQDAAADGDLQPTSPYARYGMAMLLIGLVALQLLIMNTRWLVSDNYLGEPPDRTANYDSPNAASVTPVSFGHQIALHGYTAKAGNNAINLTLYWQALTQPLHAYTVFTHVLDANGQQVGQQDNMPVRDQVPTSCWRPGEYLTDPYSIPLNAGARGPYKIEVGLYRADTGARLPRDDAEGNSVMLEAP